MPQRKNTDIVNEMFFGERAAGLRDDTFLVPSHLDRERDAFLIANLYHVDSRERFEEVYPAQMWEEIDDEVELEF